MRFALKMTALLLALVLAAGVGPTVSAQEDIPWITVDTVMVNKLGGVSVRGTMSCAAIYHDLTDGNGITYWAEDGPGQWSEQTISADEDDWITIGTNPDNYVVSEPAGRKGMIQVEHGSSRLQWCFSNVPAGTFDWTPPCHSSGAPCTWVTDRVNYDSSDPLYDYSADGKFKPGLLNVDVTMVGVWIEVYRDGCLGDMVGASIPMEGFSSQIVKAVRS